MKVVRIVNLALLVLVVGLLFNLLFPLSTITGNIIYTLRPENYQCLFHTEGQLQKIPLERCCFEIQAQLRCEHHSAELWKCFTAIDSPHFYLINDQTYRYCQIEGYELG